MSFFRRLLGLDQEAPVPAVRPRGDIDSAWTVPVLEVAYLPALGDRTDQSVTGDVGGSLDGVRRHARSTGDELARVLEEASRYKGYADAGAPPSLRYEIVERMERLEPLPTWPKPGHAVPMTDYNAIMERIDARYWVTERGVKEIWIWGYHGGVVDLWESNMSGPWGDISNSDRDPADLPVFDRTYTVYHYNYGRGLSEAMENHMHQIEAVLNHVDRSLFWDIFVKECGWSHIPPNGERDYDWANPRMCETAIEDWRPDGGGTRKRINSSRWGGDSLQWFVYWCQNLPGRDNGLTYRGRPLTNWWRFIGDWDGAMADRAGLVERG
jgi:hypothetical protein